MADTDLNAATLTVTITEALAVGHDNGSTDSLDFAQTYTHTFGSIMYTGTTVEGGNGGSTLDNATALKVKGVANHQLEVFIASV